VCDSRRLLYTLVGIQFDGDRKFVFKETFMNFFFKPPQNIWKYRTLKKFSAASGSWDFKCDSAIKHLSDYVNYSLSPVRFLVFRYSNFTTVVSVFKKKHLMSCKK